MTFHLETAEGELRELAVQRWHEPASDVELGLLGDLEPPVLDVGCGPGRIAAALSARGRPALGIDIAPAAVRSATESGAAALCRSVFDPVPGEGRWASLVLLDGNIGIGGDPVALLRRCAQLGRNGATLVFEVEGPGVAGITTTARIRSGSTSSGPWFPWSVVSVHDVPALAAACGAELCGVTEIEGRHFARLVTERPRVDRPGDPTPRTLAVIAKSPRPGRVKTRLSPPCSPLEAARVAEAALGDTLASVAAARADRRVLVLDGPAGPWIPPGFEVIPQVEGTLGARLHALFVHIAGSDRERAAVSARRAPIVVVGMDTPQVPPAELESALSRFDAPSVDAVLGRAPDGGYWSIGFRREVFDRGLRPFEGVPMSTDHTADVQLRVLAELGLGVDMLAEHRDIDHWDEAVGVAASHPHLRTSAVVEQITQRHLVAGRAERLPSAAESR
ncbi:MAG: DUF2064 domain-containing protein [Microthrixaceae bacterium]